MFKRFVNVSTGLDSIERSSVILKRTSVVDSQISLSLCLLCMADDPQVQDLHVELLRMKKEKTELQRARLEVFQPVIQSHGSRLNSEEGGNGQRGPDTECRSGLTGEEKTHGVWMKVMVMPPLSCLVSFIS